MDLGRLFRRGTRTRTNRRHERASARCVHAPHRAHPGEMLLRPPATKQTSPPRRLISGGSCQLTSERCTCSTTGSTKHTPADPRFRCRALRRAALLPLPDLLQNWDQWAGFEAQEDMDEFAASNPEGFVQPKYSTRGWIPLTHDGSGNHIGVDLNRAPPAPPTGHHLRRRRRRPPGARAVADVSYLEQVADLIESGAIVPSDDEDDPTGR